MMEKMQMEWPMDPVAYWDKMKKIMEEVIEKKFNNRFESDLDESSLAGGLLKMSEVCTIFKVSRPTIYAWLKQGTLKSVKIESRRFFLWKDIETAIETNSG